VIAFRVTDIGNLELSFRSASMRVREALRRAVPNGGRLVAMRTREKLSGEVLRNDTGRLRRNINQVDRETATSFETRVGTNVQYAHRHEFGFRGTETVRAHVRTQKQAFGRRIAARKVDVRSFTRLAHTPERSFLRSALRELTPTITQNIERAVTAAVEGA
jgi:phage gpG-like protein